MIWTIHTVNTKQSNIWLYAAGGVWKFWEAEKATATMTQTNGQRQEEQEAEIALTILFSAAAADY